ncbi:dihydrofolate reductase family protein [Periweissella beninensis]|uniref:dihydrofolate reductase family protein n=1 Tax=Periweissella beninensis TaxID=504936 RepID=UPI0021A2A711|nr:dihydrofolate reductase family protein [Periweissella beninensis]MCT4396691.1 hypothetical protein [Periweissella beninensis]
MSQNRPYTTLFLLSSLDGKISSGNSSTFNARKEWYQIPEIAIGLQQFVDIKQTVDAWLFTTAKSLLSFNVNHLSYTPERTESSIAIIDNHQRLTRHGRKILANYYRRVVIFTEHPNYPEDTDNVTIIYQAALTLGKILAILQNTFSITNITIEAGGSINAALLKAHLIDRISIVLAPLIVGGQDTPTIADGESLTDLADIQTLIPLRLEGIHQLDNSFLQINYSVIKR